METPDFRGQSIDGGVPTNYVRIRIPESSDTPDFQGSIYSKSPLSVFVDTPDIREQSIDGRVPYPLYQSILRIHGHSGIVHRWQNS